MSDTMRVRVAVCLICSFFAFCFGVLVAAWTDDMIGNGWLSTNACPDVQRVD